MNFNDTDIGKPYKKNYFVINIQQYTIDNTDLKLM